MEDKKFLTSIFFVKDWKAKNKNELFLIKEVYSLLLLILFMFKNLGKDSKNKSSNNKYIININSS